MQQHQTVSTVDHQKVNQLLTVLLKASKSPFFRYTRRSTARELLALHTA